MKPKRPKKRVVTGIAWYGSEEWGIIKKISQDPEIFDDTYEEWLAGAEEAERELRRKGALTERVPVDPVELTEWCQAKGVPMDRGSRSRFAADKLTRKYKPTRPAPGSS